MSSSRHIRRDDFDIESIEKLHERDIYKHRSSPSRYRSRSRKSSFSRHLDNCSRSRSRSMEEKSYRLSRDPSSHSRFRSRSRGQSRRSDKYYQTSRRYPDDRSKSLSKSRTRSRSQSYSPRHQNNRHHKSYKERNKRSTRSRSRSSSHFRDFDNKTTKNQTHSPRKPSSSISSSFSSEKNDKTQNLEDMPLPQQKEMYYFNENETIDRARIHREMEEKLRATLAKEGKVYPPPKAEASHPVFANDGSFLEIFKKMQQAQSSTSKSSASDSTISKSLSLISPIVSSENFTTAPHLAAVTVKNVAPRSIITRRRGGKILKTGVVAKPKLTADPNADPKDFWSLYLAEVNKYKNTACESEQGNRPLVK